MDGSDLLTPLMAHLVYAHAMATKAPPSGQSKKKGKTLMEKRAEKKAKKAERSKGGSTP